MNKYRFKKNVLKILKKISHLIFTCFVLFILYSLVMDIKIYSNNEEFIINMLQDSNYYMKYEKPGLLKSLINKIYKIDLKEPTTLLKYSFTYDNQFDEEYNPEEMVGKTEHIADPNPIDIKEPVVYIYNSHQLENYDSTGYEAYNITPNVLMASYILKEKLNDLGIPTIVEEGDITEFIRINNWSYDYSYLASRYFINAAKEEYPTLKYFIDIHRDSIKKNTSTVKIEDKLYAKVLFVVGLEHVDYKYNLDLANYLNNKIKLNYPGLSRGVLTKEGANVNGIYNQDISHNSMLIEVGGMENRIEEVLNTMDVLSKVIEETVNEKG